MDTTDCITPAWLTERLRANGYLLQSEIVALQIIARHKHHLKLRAVYLGKGAERVPADLILKWYEREHPHGWHEGVFYRDIAPAMEDPPIVPCYDAVVEGEFGQTHVLLADLSATHLPVKAEDREYATEATFRRALDAYLDFHTHWWDHPRISCADMVKPGGLGVSHEAKGAEAIQANERFFLTQALPRWVDAQGDQFPQAWQGVWEKAVVAWARLYQQRTTAEKALTLIQGDAHLENVLIPRQSGRAAIIDWEGLTRGLGVWDLSRFLLCFSLAVETRRHFEEVLLRQYYRRVDAAGIAGYSLEMCRSDYRLCILANIAHVLVWGDPSYMRSTMAAYRDWACEELLL
ncbi:MAG: phosphotransferase [Candidatus Latescibacteria bacterium]|nr:phosphotransferase [Candidatus Latescibacterota bacterium]